MTPEIGFYHLTRTGPADALPPLLGRTLKSGKRAVICCDPARVAALDASLWLCPDPDWLPHADHRRPSRPADPGSPPRTPPANSAQFLFLLDGAPATLTRYERVFDLFDGNDEQSVAAARARWRDAKAAGHSLTYWQQGPKGWDRKG